MLLLSMMYFILFFLVANAQATSNLQTMAAKAFTLGLQSGTVTDEATLETILTCVEPSIIAQLPVANLTQNAQDCIMKDSGNFLIPVSTLYEKMQSCLGSSPLAVLDKVVTAAKPLLTPLYDQLNGNITKWKKNTKLTSTQVANNLWAWIDKEATKKLINKYCTELVNDKDVTETEWTCLKNPGNQIVDFTSYSCYKLNPGK